MDLRLALGRSLDAARKAQRIHALHRKIAGIARHRREFPHHLDWDAGKARAARRFLQAHGMRYSGTRWHECYFGATGRFAPHYVPEDYFYLELLPRLNPLRYIRKYGDKNFYASLGFPNLPITLGGMVNGRPVDAGARALPLERLLAGAAALPEVVAKPSLGLESGGGAMVTMCPPAELPERLGRFAAAGVRDIVIQAPVAQHPALAELNPTSVNTVRVMTLRLEGEVEPISSVLRIGRRASRVDNGGIACGIAADGTLKRHAYRIKTFERFEAHPDHGLPFLGKRVPGYARVLDFCRDAHARRIPDVDLVSWDIAIDPSEQPVLIEFNLGDQEINFHQLANGPLFGEHTERVLALARD